MKLRKLLIVLALTFGPVAVYSQNQAVPDYVSAQPLPDSVTSLRMKTLDGTSVTLGQILERNSGKKIVVDVWASWCRDCIVGYPKLDALRKEVKGESVVFLFLSVDKDETKWKAAIERFNIMGEHFLLEGAWKNPLSNYIVLDWIPRYFVLNESARIIMAKAINADDPALASSLK